MTRLARPHETEDEYLDYCRGFGPESDEGVAGDLDGWGRCACCNRRDELWPCEECRELCCCDCLDPDIDSGHVCQTEVEHEKERDG